MTSTSAYFSNSDVEDVIAYRNSDWTKIIIYSPVTIFAPEDSSELFKSNGIGNQNELFHILNISFDNFDTSKVKDFHNMFYFFSTNVNINLGSLNFEGLQANLIKTLIYGYVNSVILPYNIPNGVKICISSGERIRDPRFYTLYKDSSGNEFAYVGATTDINNEIIGCSTKTNKVKVTYSRTND